MGKLTVIDPNSSCFKCDDQILNDPAPVTANVQMHDEAFATGKVWHRDCVPEEIQLIIDLEEVYDRENPDG